MKTFNDTKLAELYDLYINHSEQLQSSKFILIIRTLTEYSEQDFLNAYSYSDIDLIISAMFDYLYE